MWQALYRTNIFLIGFLMLGLQHLLSIQMYLSLWCHFSSGQQESYIIASFHGTVPLQDYMKSFLREFVADGVHVDGWDL